MTARIALVTDSTADIPPTLAQERQVYVVPLYVIWGADNLKDGIDITPDDFFKRLPSDPILPTTSQPSPAEFAEIYQQARDETDAEAVMALTISADLSGTYASAQQATRMVDFPAYAIDLRSASIGTGLGVLEVADARDSGASPEEILALARSLPARIRLYFLLGTLEYLHKGGRIGGARRFLGTALNIKPILQIRDGRVEAHESVRTRKRAFSRLVEIFWEVIDPARPLRVGVLHSAAEEDADALGKAIVERCQPTSLVKTQVGATIGVHAGPGAVGFAVLQ